MVRALQIVLLAAVVFAIGLASGPSVPPPALAASVDSIYYLRHSVGCGRDLPVVSDEQTWTLSVHSGLVACLAAEREWRSRIGTPGPYVSGYACEHTALCVLSSEVK